MNPFTMTVQYETDTRFRFLHMVGTIVVAIGLWILGATLITVEDEGNPEDAAAMTPRTIGL